eukprot:c20955_g1_i1 orf=327-743(+)
MSKRLGLVLFVWLLRNNHGAFRMVSTIVAYTTEQCPLYSSIAMASYHEEICIQLLHNLANNFSWVPNCNLCLRFYLLFFAEIKSLVHESFNLAVLGPLHAYNHLNTPHVPSGGQFSMEEDKLVNREKGESIKSPLQGM